MNDTFGQCLPKLSVHLDAVQEPRQATVEGLSSK